MRFSGPKRWRGGNGQDIAGGVSRLHHLNSARYTANRSRCTGAVRGSPARSRQIPSRAVLPRRNVVASASRSWCASTSAGRYPPVSAMRTTMAESHDGLLHGYTVLAMATIVPSYTSASPACTRQPRRTFRAGPSNGADQQEGQRGVGGAVGAKAADRRVGSRSDISKHKRSVRNPWWHESAGVHSLSVSNSCHCA
jgi:hypothetical protein